MLRLARIAVVLVALLVVAVAPSRAQNASDAFALQFDGADDFVALPDAPEINETPRDERSIEAWFKVDDKTINTRKQVIFEEGGGTNGLNLYVFDGALYVGAWSEGTGFAGEWLQTSSIQSGTWHHVAFVYDKGSSFTGYLDGSAFGSVGVSSTMDSHSGDVAFGRMQNNTKFHDGNANGDGHELKGSIDEGRVWNAVRTQSQIQNRHLAKRGLVDEQHCVLPGRADRSRDHGRRPAGRPLVGCQQRERPRRLQRLPLHLVVQRSG
jgi:hypothetical protein